VTEEPSQPDENRRNRDFLRREIMRRNELEAREDNEETLEASGDRRLVEFACECGYNVCIERIRLEPARYREIHGDRLRFVVYPHHELPDVEDVLERNEDYFVVKKRELPGM
jgi:hypothetical protein